MRIFHYDNRGIYAGSAIADPSPLEPGQFLVPARCTTVAPPDAPDGHVAKWNGADWSLALDRDVDRSAEAAAKLAEFLASNPDVVQLINPGDD